jgi:hypothetical protein
MKPEKWLILSHAFNMDGRAASQTITDKIPHLMNRGVVPIVISAITGHKDKIIEHHQLLPWSPAGLRFDLRHVIRKRVRSKILYKVIVGLMSLVLLPGYLLEKMFLRLEPQWSWVFPAYFKAAKLIRERQPAILYTTGGANSAHWAGYWLSKRFAIPWIAEIHDPMAIESQAPANMAQRFSVWLEGRICDRASLVFWFTRTALERARKRYPALGDRGKWVVPGNDRPDFGDAVYRKGPKFLIGHFGSLSDTRNLAVFIEGLERFLSSHPGLTDVVRLQVYGTGLDSVSRSAVAAFRYPNVIEALGRLENDPVTGESGRRRVLRQMRTVDCLLLLHGLEPFCEEYIPSKTYEYLWTQRPLLALVWRNAQMKELLESLGHLTVNAEDANGVKNALETLWARWNVGALADNGVTSPHTTEAAVDQLYGWTRQLAGRHTTLN